MEPTPKKPISPKVAAGALAGAIVVLFVGVASRLGLAIEPAEASALTMIVIAIIAYRKAE